MKKIFLYLSIILITVALTTCSSEKEIIKSQPLGKGEKLYFFYYESGLNDGVLKAYPVEMSDDANSADALTLIMDRLSNEFSKGREGDPVRNIKFELKGISYAETNIRNYPIAFVNISDPDNIMQSVYFQGSTGGMQTQNTILLNVLQPQIPGFMDGCIIYINNIPIGEMDHVNLTGILPSAGLVYLAKRVSGK